MVKSIGWIIVKNDGQILIHRDPANRTMGRMVYFQVMQNSVASCMQSSYNVDGTALINAVPSQVFVFQERNI